VTNYDQRIRRLQAGEAPRVLDLFSGCGGFSLGLHKAGFEIVAGLDHDLSSAETWFYNHRPDLLGKLHSSPSWDIRQVNPERFLADLSQNSPSPDLDVLCGGPPCQAYSRIGKGKLRSLSGEDAHLMDERGNLYHDFLRYVKELHPLVVIVENVPDSVNYGGENIPDAISRRLRRMGYRPAWTILNSAEYGVPQYRQRVFLIAFHESLGKIPSFPSPTHQIVKTNDWQLFNDYTVSFLSQFGDKPRTYFVPSPMASATSTFEITTRDALDDLPRITSQQLTENEGFCKDINKLLTYFHSRPKSAYQQLMREWPGFETDGWVTGNALRRTPRDYPIFREMSPGDQYPEALDIAEEILQKRISLEEGYLGRSLEPKELSVLRKSIVPPYDRSKFESKWTKLKGDKPSHTIVAHLQYDTYSHIHYDSEQARAISVREAARLQSFPDGFRFLGAMRDAFRMIGNAVPPLLAEAIGRSILRTIR
jgi:DNA (cytosine-5)-methyltransferase 1